MAFRIFPEGFEPPMHKLEVEITPQLVIIFIEQRLNSMEVNTQILQLILGLKKITNISNLMSRKVKQYTLHEKGIIHTTKKEIAMIAFRLNKRCPNSKPTASLETERGSQRWFWGEQKLFIWTVIYYAQALYIETSSIDSEQFLLILQLFPLKDQQFLRFEFVSTFCDQNTIWTSQEIDLLTTIAQGRQYQNQWKKISYEMFIHSQGRFFKCRESCRNRWFNYINPIINKNEWSNEEDQKMVNYILKHGTRWAVIAREVCQGRNEHMVKNRYRSLVRKLKISEKVTVQEACREMLKFFGQRKTQTEENNSNNLIQKRSNTHSQAKNENPQKTKVQNQTQKMNPQDPIEQGQSYLFECHQAKELLSIDEIFTVLNKRNSNLQNQQYMETFDCWLERFIRNQEDTWTIQNYLQ